MDLDKGPETVSLYELENEYDAVTFNHRLHAEMSAMGGECSNCHHFSEGGTISACKECHPTTGVEDHPRQPGLKGAYHRQCMKCHEEWSGVTSCEMCHAKKTTPGSPAKEMSGAYEQKSRFFPLIEQPEKKVWRSSYGGGTVVTLFHKHHTERYGIECASCHHAEGCGSCHRQGSTTQEIRHSEEALHAICNSCHAEMSCTQCHLKQEAAEFTHDKTGWPLSANHVSLPCRSCHGKPTHFSKPSPVCNSCHAKWNRGNFDHSRAGLVLSEPHLEIDCQSCHADRDFNQVPACTECHGTDLSFPSSLPGNYSPSRK
jgi:hypothetical protein